MAMAVPLDLEYKRKEEREEVTVRLWQVKNDTTINKVRAEG
jgi:hypothetical protein